MTTEQIAFHEPFKRREFLGDKLLNVLVCDVLLERGLDRKQVSELYRKIVSNAHLAGVFDRMGMEIHPEDKPVLPMQNDKRKGNAVEEYFWSLFLIAGYDTCRLVFTKYF